MYRKVKWMIEVIYDKDKEMKKSMEENSDTEEQQENEHAVSIGLKLPKNIRQIGSPDGHKRIYIEDYVVTYLNYISRPGSTQARGAVLFGECKKSDLGDVIFISGAVDAQNIEFDMDESTFTQEAWTDIYDQAKSFFPGLSVVGWFLSRMGFSTAINDKIEKMHIENFPGRDKVLFVTDSLESDDAFYMYEHGQLKKQKGYYIYYEKNEQMQNYIIKQKGDAVEENSEIRRKDEELIKQFRKKNSQLPETKESGISFVYVASSFVVLALLAMGITVVSNYDKMKEMEISINRLEITAEATDSSEDYQEVFSSTETVVTEAALNTVDNEDFSDAPTVEELVDQYMDSQNSDETVETTEVSNVTEESTEEESAVPVIREGDSDFYVIQIGDSLTSIALRYYGDADYASNIAIANELDIKAPIYEGQKILLPKLP